MDWSSIGNMASTIVTAIGAVVTAVATICLWRVTQTLAVETRRMADMGSQPHVVATLRSNPHSMMHFDLHVDNTGNATAYDIEVSFDPVPAHGFGEDGASDAMPFSQISVLNPGQGLSSYLSEFSQLEGKSFQVTINWKRSATSKVETNSYTLNMADQDGVSKVGEDPTIQIAKHLKKMEENWSPVARGSKRIKVDVFGNVDRLHEQRSLLRQRRQRTRQQHGSSTNTK